MEKPIKKQPRKERARRFSGRTRLLMLLAAAILAAAALLLLLPTIQKLIPSKNQTTVVADLTFKTIETGDTSALESVTVTHDDGESYTLFYRDQKLYLSQSDGTSEMINESYINTIVKAATEISVEDTVAEDASEVAEYLGDMGLEPPKITAQVTYGDGREVTLSFGVQAPETSYYYYRWSGDNAVYLCDSGVYEIFEYTAQMLLPVDQPTMSSALIDRVLLTRADGDTIECTFADDGDAVLGTLKQPFVYPMDSEATTNLLNACANFRLGTKIGDVTEENRASYGFDAPTVEIDVHSMMGLYSADDADGVLQTYQIPESDIHLTIGATDGDYFYFCEYAGICYRVSSFLITTLVTASAEKLATRAPASMGGSELSAIDVQVGGGAMEMRVTRTEHVLENNQIETDSSGNTVYDVAVTLNGAASTEDAYNTLVERLQTMKASGDAPTDTVIDGTPKWQMTLTTTSGATRTIAAYPMDAFNDLLSVDGVVKHYLNAEALQIALGELYPVS